jgi:fatty acid synthase
MLDASLQCVKPYGHFCEIGKYDLQNNTLIGLKSLELNVSYHAVELSTMFKHPHLSVLLKGLLQEALDKREVVPLNHGVFDACDVEQALRFMSAGKHRGKVLVNMQGFSPNKEALRFTTSGTHIITGGLGGFGLELAKWLLEQGAAKVIATGRSGITTGWQKYRAEAIWAKFGSGALEVSHKDVRDEAQCTELLHAANGGGSGSVGVGGGSLKGVWHVAMVLQDTLFKNMTAEKWALSNGVKVQGVENLDRLTEEFFPRNQLDAFVAFSSVSSLFGNVGQANYAHANNACETVVAARAARGLKACAIQWGMIDNVGVLGQGASGSDAKVLETFLAFQNIDSSLNSLHTLVQAGGVVTSYRLSSNDNAGGDDGDGEAEAFELSIPTIQNKFAEILGGNGSDYDQDSPLNDYGLDSLSSIEVVNWMNRHTTRTVNPSFMTSDMTINKMHAHMAAHPK